MSLWQKLRKHCYNETDKDALPKAVLVSCDERDDFSITVTGKWIVQKRHSQISGISLPEDEENELFDWPEYESITLSERELFEEVGRAFFDYLDEVRLENAHLKGINLFGPNYGTGFIDGASARMSVESTSDLDSAVRDIQLKIADVTRELEDTVEKNDVVTVRSLLSDRDVCQVDTVDAKILTQRPSDFFEGVQNIDELARTVADDQNEEREIVNSDGYVGMFIGKSSMDDYELPQDISRVVEEDVRQVFESTVHTELDTVLEGEMWSANISTVPSDYYSFASGTANCDELDTGRKSVLFWVHSPVKGLDTL